MNEITQAIVQRFDAVAGQGPQGHFAYPVGDAGLTALGYAAHALPSAVRHHFCGVGNVLRAAQPRFGEYVLDLGCGAGVDALLAAMEVGTPGAVLGVDRSSGMVRLAQKFAADTGIAQAEFCVGSAATLPLPSASVDCVISNGVFSLIEDKNSALTEIFRVLRPGGRVALADQVRVLAPLQAVPAREESSAKNWAL